MLPCLAARWANLSNERSDQQHAASLVCPVLPDQRGTGKDGGLRVRITVSSRHRAPLWALLQVFLLVLLARSTGGKGAHQQVKEEARKECSLVQVIRKQGIAWPAASYSKRACDPRRRFCSQGDTNTPLKERRVRMLDSGTLSELHRTRGTRTYEKQRARECPLPS